jgi:CheY-like chemotaxis protein
LADQKRILICEDEYFMAELLKVRFESLGYAVTLAGNGVEGLEALRKEPTDLVIMDVLMPVMDGFTAVKEMKADEKLKSIPVIFLTALNRHEDHIKAHEAGGNDFAAKPFEAQELVAKVKRWLGD